MFVFYHNSSYLELGGSPDKAVKSAFTYAIDKYLQAQGKYTKNEQKICSKIGENLQKCAMTQKQILLKKSENTVKRVVIIVDHVLTILSFELMKERKKIE